MELKGKIFDNLAVVGKEDAVYCNAPENIIDWDSFIPICYDPLYGILYYADYGRDYKIYALKDNVAEIAVEMSGRRLFCRNGKLYFIADSYGQLSIPGAKSGNILSYDPVNGNIAIVSDQVFDSMIVFQDMIYCQKWEYDPENIAAAPDHPAERYYFYSFDTGELSQKTYEEIPTYVLDSRRYQQYFMAVMLEQQYPEDMSEEFRLKYEALLTAGAKPEKFRTGVGSLLCLPDGSDKRPLKDLQVARREDYYIKGDDVIWFTQDQLHTYHIPTQQEETIPVDIGKNKAILMNHKVYAANGLYMDLEDGNSQKCEIILQGASQIKIREFFIGGNDLYCIARYSGESENGKNGVAGQLFRIDVAKEGGSLFFRLAPPGQASGENGN